MDAQGNDVSSQQAPQQPDNSGKEEEDVVQFVQSLLQQMQERFQSMSDQILNRIDDMGSRIDDLEQNLNSLMASSGMEPNQQYHHQQQHVPSSGVGDNVCDSTQGK